METLSKLFYKITMSLRTIFGLCKYTFILTGCLSYPSSDKIRIDRNLVNFGIWALRDRASLGEIERERGRLGDWAMDGLGDWWGWGLELGIGG